MIWSQWSVRMFISVGLMMFAYVARIAGGLVCERSTVLNGTPCQNNGEMVSGVDACEAMAPGCCSYSVGYINCFVNKEYKENQGHDVCTKKDTSVSAQLSINSDENHALFAVGGLLSTHQVVSELHCLDLCYRDHLCNAYNYQHSGGRSGLKVCELLFEVNTIGTKREFRYRIVDHDRRKVLFTSSECKS